MVVVLHSHGAGPLPQVTELAKGAAGQEAAMSALSETAITSSFLWFSASGLVQAHNGEADVIIQML